MILEAEFTYRKDELMVVLVRDDAQQYSQDKGWDPQYEIMGLEEMPKRSQVVRKVVVRHADADSEARKRSQSD